MSRMPVLFVSHGSPLQALQEEGASAAWAKVAGELPRPHAILIVSAHWETAAPCLTGAARLSTIHDFGGFDPALYDIRYDVPGAPHIAEQAVQLFATAGVQARLDAARGLDHGAWVPLLHMYPKRDVPVVQLSVQPAQDAQHHYRVGETLAPLREQGVLIIGSGHITHNLRDFFRGGGKTEAASYARDFAEWVADGIRQRRVPELLRWQEIAPGAQRAHPTPEHFLPLFVALGATSESDVAERFFQAFEGVLAMDAYRFGS